MAENENPANADSTPSTPPRRRRAASRPAGPPPEVAALAQPAAEKPKRTRRATRPAAEAALVAETAAPAPVAESPAPVAEAPAPRTRRRAASRPAAAPNPQDSSEASAPAPVAEAQSPAADATVAEVQAPVAEAPARRTRRRAASRPAAAPNPQDSSEASAPAPVAEAQSPAADATVADSPVAEVQAPVAEAPAPRTRRRAASRPAAAPEPIAEVAEPDESTDEAALDGIAAALRMAEEAAVARRNLVSDPFAVTLDRQARLAELAGAIAAGEQAEADQAEDEELDESEDLDSQPSEEADDSTESEDSDEDTDEPEDSDDDDDRPSRRRRRRGGRRRRRSNSRDDSTGEEATVDAEVDSADAEGERESQGEDDDSNGEDGTDDDSGVTRRRRRRRRRGEDSNGERSSSASDEVTGIEGSTRMEAKRQRRRENRAAGRRRAPILSEAEFLARRESVDRKLLIRQADEYTQLAVVEDGILVEHYVDRASATSLIGNVYLGKVQNVLPSMEAAFIDIGRGRNAVLYAGEVDWESFGVSAEDRKVEKVFKSGQAVLVQVTKDPVGAKGARLTGHISLPGRYIVYSPGGHLSGISRKLPDAERARLREILGGLISDEESVIVRTAAEGASSEELIRDVNRLKAQWEVIEKKVKQGKAPVALYSEPDLTLRIVRDLFTEDFGKLLVQGNGSAEDSWDAISAYVTHVAPHLAERLEQFSPGEDGRDLFAEYRIDEQIAKALDRKVYLPSGGSLVIDRTEAMTVIDVNTGRFTGAGGNLEATVTSNNLEAAEEIVRQLRLRDLGGIIVIDFIDMVLPSNRELLLRRLIECLGRDRTRHQVAEVTSLGLVQLTRKRIGTGLAEAFTEECEHCHGSGYQRFDEPVDSQAPSDGGDRSANGGHTSAGRRRAGRRGGDQRH